MTQALTEEMKDAAWASLQTPLSRNELVDFCQDIERLYRINPMLEFNTWQALGDHRYRLSVTNISQQPAFELDTELEVETRPDGFRINYSGGLKSSTTLIIEEAAQGSKLTIIDNYEGLSEAEREARMAEVDKSLVIWANYLQNYLISWHKWSKLGPWRWYMRRFWQPMKPSSRRIAYMFWWISLVEVALIALGVAIYFTEYA